MSEQQPFGGRWKKVLGWLVGSGLALLVGASLLLWSLGFWPITLPTSQISQQEAEQQASQLTAMLDKLLQKHVSAKGRVRYKDLASDQATLDRYLSILAHISPDTHPKLFATRQAQLAYWINAYNASVLRVVLHVAPWKNLTSYPRKVRFFALIRFVYGKKRTNLYDLENKWIRPTFKEPRIHFALNCASNGCPHLPQEAFSADRLNEQLDRETKTFVLQTRNVRVDSTNRTIHLSSIFQWFRQDFTDWLKAQNKPKQASDRILDYINLYRPKGKQLPLQGYKIKYIPYDWNLNQLEVGS